MIFILYNYIKLLCNIGYIYYYEVDIHNNTKWIDRLYNNIQDCGSMAIKCVQWILPRYQLYNKKSKLSKGRPTGAGYISAERFALVHRS